MLVRDRIAPRPNVGIGIEGWLRWEKRTRAGIITQAGEQHNLLLNSALDMFATHGLGTGIGTYAVVGTGSTEPAITDVSLDAELGRDATTTSGSQTITGPGVIEYTTEKEFEFADVNGNLTEWGMAPSSTGDLAVRELFRDDLGNPITVTKTSAEKLRLVYTIRYTCGPIVPEAVAVPITGFGTINGKHCLTSSSWNSVVDYVMRAYGGSGYAGPLMRYVNSSTYAAAFSYDSSISASHGGYAGSVIFGGYTPGTYQRGISMALDTATGNGTHYGWAIHKNSTSTGSRTSGWAFVFDSGESLPKDDLHMLDVDLGTISWNRA